jgi:hypothetical protein
MAKAAARQQVTIHYRRLEDVTGAFGGVSLEAADGKAMNQEFEGGKVADHWKPRAWLVPPSSEDTLLMNLKKDGGTYYFGDLTHYTKGYLQTLLAEAADTRRWQSSSSRRRKAKSTSIG